MTMTDAKIMLEIFRMNGFAPSHVEEEEAWINARLKEGKVVASWNGNRCRLHCLKDLNAAIAGSDATIVKEPGDHAWHVGGVATPGEFFELRNSGAVDAFVGGGYAVELDDLMKQCLMTDLAPEESAQKLVDQVASSLKETKQPSVMWNLYGKLLQHHGKTIDAAKAFRAAIEYNQSFGEAYANFGAVLWAGGVRDEAFTMMCEGVLRNPLAEAAWMNFLDAGYELGLYEQMERIIAYIREQETFYSDTLDLHRAVLFVKMGRFEDAEKQVRGYLTSYPDDEEGKRILETVVDLLKQEAELGGAPVFEERPPVRP